VTSPHCRRYSCSIEKSAGGPVPANGCIKSGS
jgi:hypothetical protein